MPGSSEPKVRYVAFTNNEMLIWNGDVIGHYVDGKLTATYQKVTDDPLAGSR